MSDATLEAQPGRADQTRKPPGHHVTMKEAFWVWLRVALLSFGGPAGQISVMHRIIVEEKRWIGEQRFLHALNYCMLLPGPEAQQLAAYIGWLMHRTLGGVIAGLLFVLPGAVSIMALSMIYVAYGDVGFVGALFFGLKAAILSVVLQAVIRLGRRSLKSPAMTALAAIAFIGVFFFAAPFPVIVFGAGLVGFIASRAGLPAFFAGGGHGASRQGPPLEDKDSLLGEELPEHARASGRMALVAGGISLLLWMAPVVVLIALLGPDNVFSQIAIFFSKMAVVTFGGAYAVLSYVAQQAVETYHWLKPTEMLDGLGMAETTPGPLIMVLQFVGFLGAYRDPGGLSPMWAGVWGGLLTTWVTFVPCFMFIFMGAPFMETLRGDKTLHGALSAISAAIVGVILNLSIWFAIHTIFRKVTPVASHGLRFDMPVWTSVDYWALLLATAALIATFRFKAGMTPTLLGCSAASIALYGVGLLS